MLAVLKQKMKSHCNDPHICTGLWDHQASYCPHSGSFRSDLCSPDFSEKRTRGIYQSLKRQLSSQPYIYFEFLFPFLTLILRIILRIRNTTSTMITIKIKQIPAIIAENLFGCFTRSMIFLLSSTTLRPCVVS